MLTIFLVEFVAGAAIFIAAPRVKGGRSPLAALSCFVGAATCFIFAACAAYGWAADWQKDIPTPFLSPGILAENPGFASFLAAVAALFAIISAAQAISIAIAWRRWWRKRVP